MADMLMESYNVPTWATKMWPAAAKKLKLANLPTPIHKWNLPGVPDDVEVYIKRDDLTGCTLTGTKIRMLEFLLAEALTTGCHHVLTWGTAQSNQSRAIAVACAQLGLKAHLFIPTYTKEEMELQHGSNVLMDLLCGAELYMFPSDISTLSDPVCIEYMKTVAVNIEEKTGEKSYIIPAVVTMTIGILGYIQAFEEMIKQDVQDNFDDIVLACGTGSTAETLALANFLSDSKLKIHGVTMTHDKARFLSRLNELLRSLNLCQTKPEDLLDIIEGYKGQGYELSTHEELEFITQVACQTGIMLDPVYTGKAVYGLVQEIQQNPDHFKGRKILFIHTGGIHRLFDGRMGDWLKSSLALNKSLHILPKVSNDKLEATSV